MRYKELYSVLCTLRSAHYPKNVDSMLLRILKCTAVVAFPAPIM
jgi:hypothetical protein